VLKGKITISENYFSTISAIKNITSESSNKQVRLISDYSSEEYISNGKSEIKILDDRFINLNPPKTSLLHSGKIKLLAGYDESILELNSLQGQLRCVSHVCCLQSEQAYTPVGYLSLKFFTKSLIIQEKSTPTSDIILTKDISKSINDNYHSERITFLQEYLPESSLVFIDGAIFSGANTSYNFKMCDEFKYRGITPLFFVKNSESELVKQSFDFAKDYNNDLHWANSILNVKQRSQVFHYISDGDLNRSMIFTYIKVFENRSPIRIEMPYSNYSSLELDFEEMLDFVCFQYYANGSTSNIQPRIIQISELYAREILKSTGIYQEVEKLGLTKIMNEVRF